MNSQGLTSLQRIKARTRTIMTAVEQHMFGLEEVTQLCLVALYCKGHVLLEGNPGLGKTRLVRTLEAILGFPYKRIQFTPDLMPTDITGSKMPDENDRRRLTFLRGPIFTSLLLADEINRASPKTQAAMLEAMAEGEVTVQGESYRLDTPFMVLATQNPVDHEGTYALPEAQADRFMFKIAMPFPNEESLRKIIHASTGLAKAATSAGNGHKSMTADQARDEWQQFHEQVRAMSVTPALETHVVNLLLATNGLLDQLCGHLETAQQKKLKFMAQDLFRFGLGPRAAENLVLAAKAYALLFLEDRDGMAGPEAMAQVVLPILCHRVKLVFDWEERYCKELKIQVPAEAASAGLLQALLAELAVATAPQRASGYDEAFIDALRHKLPTQWRLGLLK